jgi:hypothetical protein
LHCPGRGIERPGSIPEPSCCADGGAAIEPHWLLNHALELRHLPLCDFCTDAISLLEAAQQVLTIAIAKTHIFVGKPCPLRAQLALQSWPQAFDHVPAHRSLLHPGPIPILALLSPNSYAND